MRKSLATFLVFFLLTGLALNLHASDEEKKPELRKEFVKLKYIKPNQVRRLLVTYESPYGRITANDELNILTIQDIPEIVEKMLLLIKEIDVKPVDLLFTVDLILGSMGPEEVPELAKLIKEKAPDKKLESDPLIKELKSVLSYKYYNKIGSAFIRVQDNGHSAQIIGGPGLSLMLELAPRYVKEEREDTFQLELWLRKYKGTYEGKEKFSTLIRIPLTIKSGERTVVGVSKLDGGDKALILIISGKVIK